MHRSVDGWMGGGVDEWISRWVAGWEVGGLMSERTHGWMDG